MFLRNLRGKIRKEKEIGKGRKKRECGITRKREMGRTRKKELEQIVNNEYHDVSINLALVALIVCNVFYSK